MIWIESTLQHEQYASHCMIQQTSQPGKEKKKRASSHNNHHQDRAKTPFLVQSLLDGVSWQRRSDGLLSFSNHNIAWWFYLQLVGSNHRNCYILACLLQRLWQNTDSHPMLRGRMWLGWWNWSKNYCPIWISSTQTIRINARYQQSLPSS